MTDRPPKSLEEITIGRYISAFGNMRTAPAPHFVVTGMRVIGSADEISYHMIESAHAALKLQRGVTDPATPPPKKLSTVSETPQLQETQMPQVNGANRPAEVVLDSVPLGQKLVEILRQKGEDHP